MGIVGTGSQKIWKGERQIKGHREKQEQNKSAKGKNRGRAKLKL